MLKAWWSGRVGVIDSVGVFEVDEMYFSSSDGNTKGLYAGMGVIGEESMNTQWISRALRGVDVEAYQHKGYLSRLAVVFRRPFLFAQPADGSKRKKYRV